MAEMVVDRADVELAIQFVEGDEDAVRAVYQRYGGSMYAVARWLVRDPHQASDAVQQAFLHAWRSASSFDTSRRLGPWLSQITRHVCLDILRRDGRRPQQTELTDRDVPSVEDGHATIERSWMIAEVREAIDRLPPRERVVAQLAHVEGLSHREIADRLGLPIGTVKSRSFRAQTRLATALAHLAPARPDDVRPRRGHAPEARTSLRACRDEMSSLPAPGGRRRGRRGAAAPDHRTA